MKKYFQYIILFLTFGTLISCEKEIEFNGEIVEPLVVVNSFLSTDSVVKAHLSKSKFFLSNKSFFDSITNATVSIYVNGALKENLAHQQYGLYQGTYIPKPGDSVRMVVKVPQYDGDVVSSTLIQNKSNILSVDTTLTFKFSDSIYYEKAVVGHVYYYDCDVRMRIRDNGNETNFYRLVAKRQQLSIPGYYGWDQGYFISFKLEGFENQSGNLIDFLEDSDSWLDEHLIPDDFFNGKELLLKFRTDFTAIRLKPGFEHLSSDFQGNESLKINLQTISKDLYLYLKSRRAAQNVADGFFAEPVQIFNNIRNGLGILGAQTNNEYLLELK
jgi:hypothetical protein